MEMFCYCWQCGGDNSLSLVHVFFKFLATYNVKRCEEDGHLRRRVNLAGLLGRERTYTECKHYHSSFENTSLKLFRS